MSSIAGYLRYIRFQSNPIQSNYIDYSHITFAEKMYCTSIPAFHSRGKGVSLCSEQWLMPIEKFRRNCQSTQSSWKMIGSICDLWPWIKRTLGNVPHHYSSFVTKNSSSTVVYVLAATLAACTHSATLNQNLRYALVFKATRWVNTHTTRSIYARFQLQNGVSKWMTDEL